MEDMGLTRHGKNWGAENVFVTRARSVQTDSNWG